MTELNTLLKLPKDFDASELAVGKIYDVTKDAERVFPLHIAVFLVGSDWTFYGYCVVHKAVLHKNTTTMSFEVLSLFSPDEQNLYKQKFLQAAAKTGEI